MVTTNTSRGLLTRRMFILVAVSCASVLWALAFFADSLAFATAAVVATGTSLTLIVRSDRHEASQTVSGTTTRPESTERDFSPATPHQRLAETGTPVFVAPASLEPHAVVRALLENARMLGPAVSAHMWLMDAGSNTLRFVDSDGLLLPTSRPVDAEDSLLGRSVRSGEVTIGEVARITTPKAGTTTTIRVALPIRTQDVIGVAAIDYSDTPPNGTALTALGVNMRLPLASALGLFLARTRTDDAKALIEAARELSRALDPTTVLSIALDRAMTMSDAATGSIMMLDAETSMLRIAHASGLPDDIVDSTVVSVGEGIAGWVAASGHPVLIEDLPGKKPAGERHGVRSAVSVPISDEDGLIGVLNVGSRSFPACFTTEHLDALEMLGRQTAVAWRNARAVREAGEMYFDTLKALALALESKDPYAAGGTERTVEHATAIARSMGLSDDDVHAVEIASLLHDVGMSVLGPVCAGSSRPLSVMEQGLLKMHPAIAADILEQAPALRQVAPIVYHHHERFDGTGYTVGLLGADIPLGARILSVADAYVAMTSERPYRHAKTVAVATKELLENAGTQFDPDVVRVFVDLLGSDSNRVPHTGT